MDNGENIPGLGDDWTFAGAKLFEWIAGFVMVIIVSELFLSRPSQAMPLLMMTWVGTTLSLAILRRQFPDEERGLRNFFMVKAGFPPPGIPTPAELQPYWSGLPLADLDQEALFRKLSLDQLFQPEEEEGEDLVNY